MVDDKLYLQSTCNVNILLGLKIQMKINSNNKTDLSKYCNE